MDLEFSERLPKRAVYGADLLKKCQRFADILADGQWSDPENRRVRISRDFKEVLGEQFMDGGVKIPQIAVTTETSFMGEKDEIGYVDEAETIMRFKESYTITVAVKEAVASTELPAWIISQVGQRRITDDDESEVEVTDASHEMLQALDFEREVEMAYTLDDEGMLEDHTIEYRYLAEGNEIDSIRYSWVESMQTFEPSVWLSDVNEMRRNDLPPITQEEIDAIRINFDRVVDTINTDRVFDAIEEVDDDTGGIYLSEADHCRRAMGMLALTARHISGMRF